MAEALKDRGRDEILSFHRLLERWFRGDEPGDVSLENAIAPERTRFDPHFTYVLPSGRLTTGAAKLDWLADIHGTRLGIAIEIRDMAVICCDQTSVAIRYQEWQTERDVVTCRLSTALFVAAPAAPNQVAWRHLHETWLADRGP